MATVSAIAYTPVKGLAVASHDEVELEQNGVRDNRRFHLIGEDGRMVNGKVAGPLVRVAATSDRDASVLSLRFPDGGVLEDEVTLGAAVETNFFGRPARGRLVGGPFSRALSEVAGRPLRLVRSDEVGAGSDRGSEGSISLVSLESLARLAQEAGIERIDGRRFRMLFTIAGVEAHEEDSWLGRSVALGEAVVSVHEVVGRCAVTTQDPDTGVPDLDTLRILGAYRPPDGGEALPMGVWGSVEQPGIVRVGDRVEPV
jgi:MOSC domain-containing protein